MLLLNFSHPLTSSHMQALEAITTQPITRVLDLRVQFDQSEPFLPQLKELMAQITLTAQEWQSEPILVNLPSYNFISAILLAELHGRMGYFPPIIRLKPVENALPPRFEVAEVLNLQAIRDVARKERY